MNDAVFISDLHLHPEYPSLTARFNCWVDWALQNTRSVYILGDFFHAWAGDDTLEAWSLSIATRLAAFHAQQIPVYFMAGNRDFLLGQRFAKIARIQMIAEPHVIQFGELRALLVHGDRYCTLDKKHQRFRKITRNSLFRHFFLALPRAFREKIVCQVRHKSQHRVLSERQMATVPEALGAEATQYGADVIIHGHTHQPLRFQHTYLGKSFEQIVLSDWEETVHFLCYNEEKAFYLVRFDEEGDCAQAN